MRIKAIGRVLLIMDIQVRWYTISRELPWFLSSTVWEKSILELTGAM
jgi:hypothetical protein